MIRCTKCQTINPSDAILCSNCQSLLEWTGVPVDPTEPVADEAADEAAEVAATRAAEEARLADEARLAEAARLAAEAKASEDARAAEEAEAAVAAEAAAASAAADAKAAAKAAAEEAKAAEDARLAEVARLAEESKVEEAARAAEEASAAAEATAAAEAMAAAEAQAAAEVKAAEESRLAEAARVAEAAQAEEAAKAVAEAKAAAETKAAADAKAAVEAKDAEAARLAEEARLAAEAKAADEARLAAEAKAAELARAEERRRAAEAILAMEVGDAETAMADDAGDDSSQPGLVRPVQRGSQPPPRRTPSEPEPDDDQPESRKPTLEPRPKSRPIVAPEPEPESEIEEIVGPGEIRCAVCGTINDATRNFCRRCGKPLVAVAAIPVAKGPPWYRRIFRPRQPARLQAGERPTRLGDGGQPKRSLVGRLVPLLVIAVIAFGVTSILIMPNARDALGDLVTDLRLRFMPQIEDVHPIRAQGAGEGRNDGRLAVDNNTATFWLARSGTTEPAVTVEIGSTINLGGLVVHSGSTTESDFTAHRRPKTLELTFPGTDRPAVEVSLDDVAEPQPVALDVRDIDTVVIRVVSWFEAGAGGDQLVAIREIEFKERR